MFVHRATPLALKEMTTRKGYRSKRNLSLTRAGGGGGGVAGPGGGELAREGGAHEGGRTRGKSACEFSFILCLSNASDTLKVQTD